MLHWRHAPLALLVAALNGAGQEAGSYHSPYSIAFTHHVKELTADLDAGPRGDPKSESSIPFAEWSSPKVRDKYGVWGPPAQHYPAPKDIDSRSVEWKRERVLAVALRYLAYGYQHHHIPDWEPPAGWPWKEVRGGKNGKGVDCSNFTAFVYNQALGIKPSGNVKKQAEDLAIAGPGSTIRAERIEKPADYVAMKRVLRTGDLLFIRNKSGEISHVVLWVGEIGRSPEPAPLILDSHGEGVKDSSGQSIPHGIHLRPIREDSWYYRSLSHALRIVRGS
jgi:hypothetical protein